MNNLIRPEQLLIDVDLPVGQPIVKTLNLISGGKGYSSAPGVNILGGGGVGATAIALLGSGQITTATVLSLGSGYSVATVMLSGGGGVGAVVEAIITSGQVTGYTIVNPGSGYTSNPTVVITGDGIGADASIIVSPLDEVVALSLTSPGFNYTSNPQVQFVGGGSPTLVAVATAELALNKILHLKAGEAPSDAVNVAQLLQALASSGFVLYHILADQTITVPLNFEYLVYEDLLVDGLLIVNGKLVVINGNLEITPGGIVDNNGIIELVELVKASSEASALAVTGSFTQTLFLTAGVWSIIVHNIGSVKLISKSFEGNNEIDVDFEILSPNSVRVRSSVDANVTVNILGL